MNGTHHVDCDFPDDVAAVRATELLDLLLPFRDQLGHAVLEAACLDRVAAAGDIGADRGELLHGEQT